MIKKLYVISKILFKPFKKSIFDNNINFDSEFKKIYFIQFSKIQNFYFY